MCLSLRAVFAGFVLVATHALRRLLLNHMLKTVNLTLVRSMRVSGHHRGRSVV